MMHEYAQEFELQKHFDTKLQPDVRKRIHALYRRTKETCARERRISLEVVLLIGCLEIQNAAVNLGLGKREHLAKSLGLSPSQYWKRAQAGRVLMAYPEFIEMVKMGRTHISNMAIIAPKISQANAEIFLKELPHKSEREVRELAASVDRDGSRSEKEPLLDLRLKVTKAQLDLLQRAQEILSRTGRVPSQEEAITKALEDLLEKRDPLRKAERAAKRKVKVTAAPQSDAHPVCKGPQETAVTSPQKPKGRKGIPAASVHAVWRRDRGCCTYVSPTGGRCGSRVGVQVDHIVPLTYSYDNSPDNLRLLCREHNVAEAERILGEHVMRQYRWIERQCESEESARRWFAQAGPLRSAEST